MDFPDIVKNLPEADIPFKGVRGWILQSEDKQIVFMDIAPIGKVDEHSHSAQFGVLLDGEMSLTIAGETKRYKKGDSYFIPENVVHSAIFHSQVKVMDMFNEKDRYKIKTKE
ncbi:MAG: cupin domain-containing protein [bacterium]